MWVLKYTGQFKKDLKRYICDTDHYNEVIARCASVKSSLWIGTAWNNFF